MAACTAVVFDVGGVLIDFDPRHLFEKVIADEGAREHFLSVIATPSWHRRHDLGEPFSLLCPELCRLHPDWEEEITLYGERFAEMWAGPIDEAVAVLCALRAAGVATYAATNWGSDTWLLAKERFWFLRGFDAAVVSGEIGLAKPDPGFFASLERRLLLDPSVTAYVDDNAANLEAAFAAGHQVVAFDRSGGLARDLHGLGLVF